MGLRWGFIWGVLRDYSGIANGVTNRDLTTGLLMGSRRRVIRQCQR
jgi:hypothetical protein